MLRALIRTILDRFQPRRRAFAQIRIGVTPSGIILKAAIGSERRPDREVSWHKISCITVFKRDVYIHDMICVLIEVGGEDVIELNEEMEGWEDFVRELPLFLPSAMRYAEWFLKVAFPAFEPAPVRIYVRG